MPHSDYTGLVLPELVESTAGIWAGILEVCRDSVEIPRDHPYIATPRQGYAYLAHSVASVKPWPNGKKPKPKEVTLPPADEVREAAELGFTRSEALELFDLPSRYYLEKLAPGAVWIDGRKRNGV